MRVVNRIHDPLNSNTWVSYPGVISGCGVSVHNIKYISVDKGRMCFANGHSATIENPVVNACCIPDVHTRFVYVIAIVDVKSVSFRCVNDKWMSENFNGTRPLSLLNAIVLAKLDTEDVNAIKVYNVTPLSDNVTARSLRLYPPADGVRNRFFLPFNVNTNRSVLLTVNGIRQIEYQDYTVNKEIAEDGSYVSVIDFIYEVPQEGSDVFVTLYRGKVGI